MAAAAFIGAGLSAIGRTTRSLVTASQIVTRHKSTSLFKKAMFNALNEADNGQTTSNPYILAKRAFNGIDPISLDTLNGILSFHDIALSEEDFNVIRTLAPARLPYPLPSGNPNIIAMIGSSKKSGTGVPGAYVLTHLNTGDQYVGGSLNLAKRVRYYYNSKGLLETRTIAQLMAKYGPSAFSLDVYVMDVASFELPVSDTRIVNMAIALEQYLILHIKPKLNGLLVVGGVSTNLAGSEALARIAESKKVPLYIYNKDMTKLVYKSDSRAEFIRLTGLNQSTVNRRLLDGELLLYTYKLSSSLLVDAEVCLMSKKQLQASIKDLYANRMKLRNQK